MTGRKWFGGLCETCLEKVGRPDAEELTIANGTCAVCKVVAEPGTGGFRTYRFVDMVFEGDGDKVRRT